MGTWELFDYMHDAHQDHVVGLRLQRPTFCKMTSLACQFIYMLVWNFFVLVVQIDVFPMPSKLNLHISSC
jgi:hypothetical protein